MSLPAFRAHVLADPALHRALAEVTQLDAFVAQCRAVADAAGIALDEDELRAAARPDPLGLDRWQPAPVPQAQWPSADWLPVRSAPSPHGLAFDWAHFAGAPLAESMFEASARLAAARPFNRLFRTRTTVGDLIANAETALQPCGFIFHMSRCGSTLAAQLLARLPDTIVLSEAEPLDAVVQLACNEGLPLDGRIAALQAIVAACGRPRSGERRLVIKLDAWHILAFPLFRQAFPDVPWAFLYRDPLEVMVSQSRQRGVQTIPEVVPFQLHGLTSHGAEEDVIAQMIAGWCQAAAAHVEHGGMLLDYAELPNAVADRLVPHFGISLDDAARASISAAVSYDVKYNSRAFEVDARAKQEAANPAIRTATEAHLRAPYQRLQSLRQSLGG